MNRLVAVVRAIALALLVVLPATADDSWRVVRSVRLLTKPQTGHRIKTLRPPTVVTETATDAVGDYIRVRDAQGDLGWVYKPYLAHTAADMDAGVVETDEGGETETAPLPAGADATQISASWDKPTPNKSQFTNQDGIVCGPDGKGGDAGTNRRKNRTDVPSLYHSVTFDAIDKLPYPVATKHRSDWSPAQLAEIKPFEGTALTVTGYLVAIKPQSGNSESCNCGMTRAAETDWHMALVKQPGGGEDEAIVVETTPRIRRSHPNWTKARLNPWVDSDDQVRISGWLMIDPEHRNHLGRYRNTLWEIHPITKIEVMLNGAWVDLDQLAGPS